MMKFMTYVAIALGAVAYNAMTEADRDSTGAIVGEGSVGAFQIRVGDCFDVTSSSFAEDCVEITSLPDIPCTDPHDNEVFAVFDVNQSTYPEGEAMESLAMTPAWNASNYLWAGTMNRLRWTSCRCIPLAPAGLCNMTGKSFVQSMTWRPAN